MSSTPPPPTTEPAAPERPRRAGLALALVIGIPLSALISGVSFLSIAGSGGLDNVADEVQRTGRIQQTNLDADLAARAANLSAEIHVEGGRLHLRLQGADPQALLLRLEHPTQAVRDRELRLEPDGAGGWQADWPEDTADWKLVLSPPERDWRIKGRWSQAEAGRLRLQPALRAP